MSSHMMCLLSLLLCIISLCHTQSHIAGTWVPYDQVLKEAEMLLAQVEAGKDSSQLQHGTDHAQQVYPEQTKGGRNLAYAWMSAVDEAEPLRLFPRVIPSTHDNILKAPYEYMQARRLETEHRNAAGSMTGQEQEPRLEMAEKERRRAEDWKKLLNVKVETRTRNLQPIQPTEANAADAQRQFALAKKREENHRRAASSLQGQLQEDRLALAEEARKEADEWEKLKGQGVLTDARRQYDLAMKREEDHRFAASLKKGQQRQNLLRKAEREMKVAEKHASVVSEITTALERQRAGKRKAAEGETSGASERVAHGSHAPTLGPSTMPPSLQRVQSTTPLPPAPPPSPVGSHLLGSAQSGEGAPIPAWPPSLAAKSVTANERSPFEEPTHKRQRIEHAEPDPQAG